MTAEDPLKVGDTAAYHFRGALCRATVEEVLPGGFVILAGSKRKRKVSAKKGGVKPWDSSHDMQERLQQWESGLWELEISPYVGGVSQEQLDALNALIESFNKG